MGYVLRDVTGNAPIRQIYNVSACVGAGCVNNSDDVKLVQYLLGC